jgi:hypothetical protein
MRALCLICCGIATKSCPGEMMSIDDLWNLRELMCSVLETKIGDQKLRLEDRLDELVRRLVAVPADVRQRLHPLRGEPKYQNPGDPSITWSRRAGIHAG